MKFRIALGFLIVLIMQQCCYAQDPILTASDVERLPAVSGKDQFWQGWKKVPQDLLQDQKRIYFSPRELVRKRHLKATVIFVGATTALIALDGHPARYFQKTKSFGGFNRVFSGPNTAKANYLVPLALYGVGLVRRDSYAQQTFILAGEAVLDSEILTSISKDIDRRLNPHGVPANGGDYSDTWFKKKFFQNLIGGNGSFPSGHTIAAFAVASVYAERYSNHRWVPWLAYGLAALDGFSRMSLRSHFGSDVFAGAGLGYIMSHKVVLGRH